MSAAGHSLDAQGRGAVDALVRTIEGAARLRLRPSASVLATTDSLHRAPSGPPNIWSRRLALRARHSRPPPSSRSDLLSPPILSSAGRADHVLEPAQPVLPSPFAVPAARSTVPVRGAPRGGDVFASRPAVELVVRRGRRGRRRRFRGRRSPCRCRGFRSPCRRRLRPLRAVVAQPAVEVVGPRAAFRRVVAAPPKRRSLPPPPSIALSGTAPRRACLRLRRRTASPVPFRRPGSRCLRLRRDGPPPWRRRGCRFPRRRRAGRSRCRRSGGRRLLRRTPVVAASAVDRVVSRPAADRVVAVRPAADPVVPAPAVDHVARLLADDRIVAPRVPTIVACLPSQVAAAPGRLAGAASSRRGEPRRAPQARRQNREGIALYRFNSSAGGRHPLQLPNPVRVLSLRHEGRHRRMNFSIWPASVDELKRGRKTATIRLGDKSRKYERGQASGLRSAFATARARKSSPRSSTTSR